MSCALTAICSIAERQNSEVDVIFVFSDWDRTPTSVYLHRDKVIGNNSGHFHGLAT